MVHRDGQGHQRRRPRQEGRYAARPRAACDLGHAMGAAVGREPHQRHDRQPPGLGDLAPARLGRADRRVRAREGRRLGRDPAGRDRQSAHHRGLHGGRRRRLVHGGRPRALPWIARERRLEEGRRHLRRLVRFRLHACLRAGGSPALPAARQHRAQGRRRRRHRDVSGRLRPASRLVSFVAAGELRHARPRALSTSCSPTASRSTRTAARCRSRSATPSSRRR